MPGSDAPLALTIGPGPQYAVSQPQASTNKTRGVEFTPPSGGCTLCITQGKIDGKTTIYLTTKTTYRGNQLDTGKVIYNTYGPNINCSNPPKMETIGNSIDVGSSMPAKT